MCFTNFSFPITLTLIIFYLFPIFNLFSKFLLTDICLPFTFSFFFLELLFTFYFLELLYFFSFTYVLFLVSTRTSNPPPLPPFVSEALFCLCRGTNIYNFWGVPEFQDTYHTFLYFLTFLVFLSGFFILLVREKHRKITIGFY